MPKAQVNATVAGLSRIPRLASKPSPGFTPQDAEYSGVALVTQRPLSAQTCR
jgi:hypothetical protein